MTIASYYPWQHTQAEYFSRLMTEDQLAHALLLTGPAGTGKHNFARTLSMAMVCQQAQAMAQPCGVCKHCLLMQAQTYPDFISLHAEKNVISVDQVRELIAKLYLTRHFAALKVAVIEQADTLNTNAANALLKTLEEPPQYTHIILVTDAPMALPATIRSRCQQIQFNPPDEQQSIEWLQAQAGGIDWQPLLRVAQGAPLKALEYHQTELLDQRISVMRSFLSVFEYDANPMQVAKTLESVPYAMVSLWIQSLTLDMLRIKAQENPQSIENPDFYRPLLALANKIPNALLIQLWDQLLEHKKIYDVSLNYRMFLETILITMHKQSIKAAHK